MRPPGSRISGLGRKSEKSKNKRKREKRGKKRGRQSPVTLCMRRNAEKSEP